MHCSVSKPQMSYMQANAAVLLYFILIKLNALKAALKIFLQTSPTLTPNLSYFSSACTFYMFAYYLQYNLLVKFHSLINCFPVCCWHIRKFSIKKKLFITTVPGIPENSKELSYYAHELMYLE